MAHITFDALYTLEEQGGGAFALGITRRKCGRRFQVRQLLSHSTTSREWCAAPRAFIGDAPNKYHPLYVAALLSSRNEATTPRDAPIPAIHFSTDADTRRSMTLNAMRMTREYSQDASPRILRLVAQRLEAGQRDVVHDALVYVMRQIVSAREAAEREAELRAQALSAYLGLGGAAPLALSPRRDDSLLEALSASTRGGVDVEAIAEMQRRMLRAAMASLRREERHYFKLLDQIVALLQK